MDKPSVYEITVAGLISDRWSDWFDGLEIRNNPDGDTILSGVFIDQSALLGTLNKIQALNLVLVSVIRKNAPKKSGHI